MGKKPLLILCLFMQKFSRKWSGNNSTICYIEFSYFEFFFFHKIRKFKKNSVIIIPYFYTYYLVNYLILKRKFLVIYYNDWTTFCMLCIVKTEVYNMFCTTKIPKTLIFNLICVFYQSLKHCVTCQKQKLPKKIYYSKYT